MAATCLRFVTNATHPPYGHRSGVFQVAYALRDQPDPQAMLADDIAQLLAWFEANMDTPTRFSVSRHPRAQEAAVSWIKACAGEHVRRLRLLVSLVETAGDLRLDELRTARPGYIVFEDDHQVVALPFADTPR